MFNLKSLFGFGLCRVFDDTNDDPNNPDASGGKPDDNKSGGGGGGGDSSKKDDNKPETYAVKIDGEDRDLSLNELKELASKSGGADKKFQAAAEASKVAERGIRIEALVKSISGTDSPDDADIRELAGLLEIDPKDFMDQLRAEETPASKGANKDANLDFNAEFQKQMGATPAEVRAVLEHSQSRHVQAARKEIREISDNAVDKDEIFGKMIVGKDKDDILLTVKDMVAEDVLKKIQEGVPFGADVVTASVQRVRSTLTKLGIPNKLNQQPIVLGLGPGEGLPSEIQADEPIKRVSSTEDGDEKNLIARYMQKGIKTLREQR
jgi:hypothetical protein